MADRDAAELAAARAAIERNNGDVAALAHGLSLDVKTHRASTSADSLSFSATVLQFDAVAMAHRIEQAGAKRKNNTRGRAKNANRHLLYICPICSERITRGDKTHWTNTVRASADDRIVLCGGRHGAQHQPTLMEFVLESQPDYRLADMAAGTAGSDQATTLDTYNEAALIQGHNRSQASIAANSARYAAKIANLNPEEAHDIPEAHKEIPF
jgi:hypothetical protein